MPKNALWIYDILKFTGNSSGENKNCNYYKNSFYVCMNKLAKKRGRVALVAVLSPRLVASRFLFLSAKLFVIIIIIAS